ncbi:MAG TPA: uracil-DNA glycosylase [Pirellulales bacterium]|nr:uracil-DNA glycosylase [Pirellulales bacterium]
MASADHLQRLARQQLESLRQAGITHLPKPQKKSPGQGKGSRSAPKTGALEPVPEDSPTIAPAASDRPLSRDDAIAALRVAQQEVSRCPLCVELAETRTQTVFGVGNPRARLCFLGEAPGADEDRQGEPFVGRAGQLLTKIIEACTLKREDVYILNVLKCRPPGNRTPLPHEVANCRGYLDRQLQIIQPEYICCLGSVAAQTLLETDVPISRLRGKFQQYRGIDVMCTYHPAYLLRNPAAKREVWEDMKRLMTAMGIKLP